jgi:hydrogenase nickel incorporation protein HypB
LNGLPPLSRKLCQWRDSAETRAIDDDVQRPEYENVGNVVCPTSYDLGEAHKIVLLSVTEGEEKPLKSAIFFKADLMAMTIVDLLLYVPFQADVAEANARSIHPNIEIVRVSSTSKTRLDGWLE